MKPSWESIQTRTMAFAKKWRDAHNEESEAQSFECEFMQVFGVEDPTAKGLDRFEWCVPLDDGHNSYIDSFWPGHITIEMKSAGKSLADAYKQLSNSR